MVWDDLTERQKLDTATRVRLPSRRHSDLVEVVHIWGAGTTQEIHEPLLLDIGRYPDGTIGEVFITGLEDGPGKVAQRAVALRGDVATLISIALQYGAPIEVLRDAVARSEVSVMGKTRVLPHTIIGTVLDALVAETGPSE
jgi:hypothetical protein